MNYSSVKHTTTMVNNIFRVDRGMVHIVVAGDIVHHYCLMFNRGVVHIAVAGYIVDHYCFMFN
jgi:hypothetical protein